MPFLPGKGTTTFRNFQFLVNGAFAYLVSVHLVECLVFGVREQGLRRPKTRSLLHEAWGKGPYAEVEDF
jgi:hypothetical protein